MKNHTGSFVRDYRNAILSVGALLGVAIATLFVWQADAQNRGIKDQKSKRTETVNGGTVMTSDDPASIELNAGAIDTRSVPSKAFRGARESFSGKEMRLVKYSGPIQEKWHAALVASGVSIVDYIPNFSYLVYGDAASMNRLINDANRDAGSGPAWIGDYTAQHRIQPAAYKTPTEKGGERRIESATGFYDVQLFQDKIANQATLARIAQIETAPEKRNESYRHYVVVTVGLSDEGVREIANRSDVISIYPYVEPKKMDERQDMILAGNITGNVPNTGDYFSFLTTWGFTQAQFNSSAFIVDVTDDGADRNPTGADPGTIATNANAGPVPARHFVLFESGNRTIGQTTPSGTSRFIYKGRWGGSSTADGGLGVSGHGQLNMSIVGGYVPTGTVGGVNFGAAPHADASGFRYGLGVAPFVRLANSVIFDPNFTNPSYPNMLSAGYTAGTRISSNSWGAAVSGAYNADSQIYDGLVRDAQSGTAGNQEMIITFSAGNDGSGATTIGSPGTGKNVFTVGAAENVHPFGGADGCGTTDAEANSANDIVGFSSRGPTADGRKKPEIQAPGTHTTGMTYVQNGTTGNGTAEATYRADGVCAGPGGSNFFPTTQQWYTSSSGTSHSNPAVAGGSALVYQQFINNPSYIATNRTPAGSAPPSSAMTKAYIINSARYMTGVSANDTLPSNNQGYGMMNLGTAFDGTARIIRDQVAADTFGATGEVRSFGAQVVDGSKPFRVTIAYTDLPGATTGNSFVNNLDLEVTAGGNTYRGNVFTGANSTTGGVADTRNNVESVFIPGGTLPTGTQVLIVVRGTNIAGDGLPGNADTTDQDFALVAYNANPAVVGALLLQQNAAVISGNNLIEPNECNTMNIPISNASPDTTATAVSAVLSTTTPNVTITQNTSAYPNIAPGGTQTNTTPFQISTTGAVACATNINLTLTVTYTGGASPNITNFTVPVGQTASPNYVFTPSTGATIPAGGTLVAGTQADDAVVAITAPFAFNVYGTSVASGATLRVNTNGNMQITSAAGSSREANGALPSLGNTGFGTGSFDATTPVLMPFWDDLIMTTARSPLAGVYQQTTGVAPNRQWIVEWRAQHWNGGTAEAGITINMAIVFNEGSENFSYIYAATGAGANAAGVNSTVGIQAATTGTQFTQFSFNGANLSPGLRLDASRPAGICTPGTGACAATAAGVEVSGRVLTSPGGRGLRGARVVLRDENGIETLAFTGAYGQFRFEDVEPGRTYLVSILSRRFQYAPQVLQINDNVTDLVFSPE
ncbi:MAG: S8 family serine peptidase [Pyrinomonadaceae bacterium]